MAAQYSEYHGISRKAPPLRPKHDPGTPRVKGPSRGAIANNRIPSMGGVPMRTNRVPGRRRVR